MEEGCEDCGAECAGSICSKCDTRRSIAEVLHCTTYRYNEATREFDLAQAADVAGFLKKHPVGTVYRIHAGAPGTGFWDYRVTHYDDHTVYGVQIHCTVRELTLGDVK